MKRALRIFVLLGLLLALVPMSPVVVIAQAYPGPYDLVVLEDDPLLIMEALAYIAAIHRLNEAPLPPILIYDGTNEDELQDFYGDYGPFDEAAPVVLTVGTVPAAALPGAAQGGQGESWTEWKSPSLAVSVARGAGDAWQGCEGVYAKGGGWARTMPEISTPSSWLRATGFGFTSVDIPEAAVVLGVEARTYRMDLYGDLQDSAVFLRNGAGQQGDNQAEPGAWGSPPAYSTYGGSANKWGWLAIAPGDILSDSFGIDISADALAHWGSYHVRGYIDHIEIRVYFDTGTRDALTVADIRDWWVGYMENEIEPYGVVSLGTDAGTTAQRDSYRALGAAETAIRNYYYTNEVPGPYLPTVAAADDMSLLLAYTHTATTYCYGPDANEYTPWNHWFAGSARVNRNERGGVLNLPPEEGIGYNMRDWVTASVWQEGVPKVGIITHQDDLSPNLGYVATIHALYRQAPIYPLAAPIKEGTTVYAGIWRCTVGSDYFDCISDQLAETWDWIDDGTRNASWADYFVLCADSHWLIPVTVTGGGHRGTDPVYMDIDADTTNWKHYETVASVSRIDARTLARALLLVNRGVFASTMRVAPYAGVAVGQDMPARTVASDYSPRYGGDFSYWAYSDGDRPTKSEVLAAMRQSSFWNFCGHGGTKYSGGVYIKGVDYDAEDLPPGVFTVAGCSPFFGGPRHPQSVNIVYPLLRRGVALAVGAPSTSGGPYWSEGRVGE